MSEYTATIKLKADRSGLTGELKIAAADVGKLNDALQGTGTAADQGAAGMKNYKRESDSAGGTTRTMTSRFKDLRSEVLSLKGALGALGIYKLTGFLKSTLSEFQDTRTMIQGLTSNSREYADTQTYLIDVAERYSGSLTVISESYARLLSLQAADIVSKTESRQLLEGLLNAGAQLKVSNEQMGLVYYGLAQSLSQVKVQAQELNQVVEPLPGILNHMDKAAGLARGGFRGMVMDGEVTAEFFKTTLIEALRVYSGAAERTFGNISSVSTRVRNQHVLLVAALEEPIDASIGSFLEIYEQAVKSVVSAVPTLLELSGDLIDVFVVLAGIKLAAWLYASATAAVSFGGVMVGLQGRTLAAMITTRAFTTALVGLRGALAFVGGPVGLAVLAGTAIYAFGTNSNQAADRTARLRSEVDDLAASFGDLTVAQVDQAIAEQQAAIAAANAQKLNVAVPVPMGNATGTGLGLGSYTQDLKDYKQEIAALDAQMESGVYMINSLVEMRAQAVGRSIQEEADATASLTKLQQDLLDKYLPLEALTAEYMTNLSALNAIEASTTAEMGRKQRAIDVLNEMYAQEVRELTGVTKAEEEAQKIREKSLQVMNKLIEQYGPMQNAVAEYETQLFLLTQARDQDLLSLENYHMAVAALAEEQRAALQPGAVLVDQMREELRVMQLSAVEQEFANRTRGLSVQQIQEQGNAIRALIIQQRDEQAGIDAVTARQEDYRRSTQNMLQDLQRSWADYFEGVLENGKFNMKTLGESILAIMRQTLASVMAMDMANAFKGSFQPAGQAAAGAGSPLGGTGSSVSLSNMASVLGGSVASVLNASMVTTSAPIYEAGQMISAGAKSFNFSMSNIGTNLLAGTAGAAIGTAVGEAVFGKKAESNWGAIIGGTVGAFVPVIGPFIGAMIGGAADAFFGGDGWKRSSVGFDTDRDSVKSKYYYGTEEFESGLTVNKINRRGDREASDAITAKGAEIDRFITTLARAAGGNLDMRGVSLSGTGADQGADGSFFGMRNGESADSEEALDALFASLSMQLIGHITGLSDEVTQAIRSATGDADSIIAQFKQALELDALVQSGQLDILGDVTFGFASDLAEAAGGIDNLAMVTQAFSTNIADQSEVMTNVAERLRGAVSEQFEALNLSLSDFTAVSQFRDYFEEVKNTLDAGQVLELMQAGNALAMLIEQEKELAGVRTAAMEEQKEAVSALVDQYRWLRTEAVAVASALQNDINKITGVNVTDLRARMRTGELSEQLDAVELLRQEILANYSEQLKLEKQLHEAKIDHYKQQLDAAKRIDDYIKNVLTGDLSPLSVADRLDLAQQQFDDVYQRAKSGDLGAAQEATSFFDTFARINQTAYASSVDGVAAFNTNLAKLQEISALLGQAQDPGEAPASGIGDAFVEQLRELQAELTRIQNTAGAEIVNELLDMKVIFANLPREIALELSALLENNMGPLLQIGTDLGLVSQEVITALGLMPKLSDLSDAGIAGAIEAVTALSQHPNMLADSIASLADAMGAMMESLVRQGAATTLLADTIAKNPTAAAAANEYLNKTGQGSLADYQSAVNPNVAAQDIASYVESIKASAQSEAQAVHTVMQDALANGIGSGQLASSTGYSQAEILALAKKYGYASFDVGTDRVDRDQLAAIHRDEIIFDPPSSNKIRQAVVDQVTGGGASNTTIQRFVSAVETQTALLAELVEQNRSLSAGQRQAFAGASKELQESIDRLTREIEGIAA